MKAVNKEVEKFAKDVIEKFTKEITDRIFLYIEENESLLKEYEYLVSKKDCQSVNSQIGRVIKVKYNVDNIDKDDNIIVESPKSSLIKTKYTGHTLK
nr:hypothetical protein [uncultured Bacteroides sp.]